MKLSITSELICEIAVFDILILILLVALFVLGLFGLVQWALGFFPVTKSPRFNPPVGKWWIILLLIVLWLNAFTELLKFGSPVEWTRKEYLALLSIAGLSYGILFVWKWTLKPAMKSVPQNAPGESGKAQP